MVIVAVHERNGLVTATFYFGMNKYRYMSENRDLLHLASCKQYAVTSSRPTSSTAAANRDLSLAEEASTGRRC